jgi:hypothetical protein
MILDAGYGHASPGARRRIPTEDSFGSQVYQAIEPKKEMTGSDRLSKTDFSGRKTETQFEEEKNWEGQLFVT